MIADEVRMRAYVAALERSVTPGCTVLDIGTGTAMHALLACQMGAGHVYAVEPNDAIQVGRELAAANGFADRITFVQDVSSRLSLPQRADVVVADLRGVLPLFGRHIETIADTRRRLLAPSGTLIPVKDTMLAAVVEAGAVYERKVECWTIHARGLNLAAARRRETNWWWKERFTPDQLLTAPRHWATIDYTVTECPDARGELTWVAERAGTAHGLALWFDTELVPGIGFSNAPGAPKVIYGQAYFPFTEAVPIAQGDVVHATVEARFLGGEYLWFWDTVILAQGDKRRVKANFRQGAFHSLVLSPDTLRRRADRHIPVLDEEGRIDRVILSHIDGGTSVGEIARLVQREFPHRFLRWEEALGRVGEWSVRYGESPVVAAPAGP